MSVLLLLSGLLAPDAHAGCLQRYDASIRKRLQSETRALASAAVGTGSSVGSALMASEVTGGDGEVLLSLAVATSPTTAPVAAAPAFLSSAVTNLFEVAAQRRVLRALQESHVGDGLALRDLSIELGVRGVDASVEGLAALLRTSDAPCAGRTLFAWDDLVGWADTAARALPAPEEPGALRGRAQPPPKEPDASPPAAPPAGTPPAPAEPAVPSSSGSRPGLRP
ncbi:MAG: hypothetical protein RLZZ299_1596 [Pseudomonadota bacterium]